MINRFLSFLLFIALVSSILYCSRPPNKNSEQQLSKDGKLTKAYLVKRAEKLYRAFTNGDIELVYEFYDKNKLPACLLKYSNEKKTKIDKVMDVFKKGNKTLDKEDFKFLDFSDKRAAILVCDEIGGMYMLQVWAFKDDEWFVDTIIPVPSYLTVQDYQQIITAIYSEITSQTLEAKNQIH